MKTLTRWLREFTADEIEVDDPTEDAPLSAPVGTIPEQAQREPEPDRG